MKQTALRKMRGEKRFGVGQRVLCGLAAAAAGSVIIALLGGALMEREMLGEHTVRGIGAVGTVLPALAGASISALGQRDRRLVLCMTFAAGFFLILLATALIWGLRPTGAGWSAAMVFGSAGVVGVLGGNRGNGRKGKKPNGRYR